jgi:hypothetical protein
LQPRKWMNPTSFVDLIGAPKAPTMAPLGGQPYGLRPPPFRSRRHMRGDCWYYSQSLVIQHGCGHLKFYNRRKAIPWGTFCCQEHFLLVWHDEIQVQIAQLRHTAMTQLENLLQRVAWAPTPVGFNFGEQCVGHHFPL